MSAPASLGLTCADWRWGVIPFDLCKIRLLCFPDTSALAGKVESQQERVTDENEGSIILFSHEGPFLILQTPLNSLREKFVSD